MSLCVGWGGGCGERRQERKYCHPDRYIKITGDYIVKEVETTNRTCVLFHCCCSSSGFSKSMCLLLRAYTQTRSDMIARDHSGMKSMHGGLNFMLTPMFGTTYPVARVCNLLHLGYGIVFCPCMVKNSHE